MNPRVRVFRIRPGLWAYIVTGLGGVPFVDTAPTQHQALTQGLEWLKTWPVREAS